MQTRTEAASTQQLLCGIRCDRPWHKGKCEGMFCCAAAIWSHDQTHQPLLREPRSTQPQFWSNGTQTNGKIRKWSIKRAHGDKGSIIQGPHPKKHWLESHTHYITTIQSCVCVCVYLFICVYVWVCMRPRPTQVFILSAAKEGADTHRNVLYGHKYS